ncbi:MULTISPECIES: hypothetical protein [unclassified Paenibacillus]|nr:MULTISPECIES: hypothetical protein [unclassified Paenibacillus]
MSGNSEGGRFCRIFVPSKEIFRRRARARQGKVTQQGEKRR